MNAGGASFAVARFQKDSERVATQPCQVPTTLNLYRRVAKHTLGTLVLTSVTRQEKRVMGTGKSCPPDPHGVGRSPEQGAGPS